MKLFTFFSYKINRRILLAFIMIIIIPGIVSYWISSFVIQNTLNKEIKSHLEEAGIVYFKELNAIEKNCVDIASAFSVKDTVVKQILNEQYINLEKDMINFYSMNLVDIIEIEDMNGKVIFRGHNPNVSGDIKIDQNVVKEGLAGKTSISYEHGKSGFAIRAVAPVFDGKNVIGIFMAGSLFSEDFVDRMKSLTLLDNGIYRGTSKIISTYAGKDQLTEKSLVQLKKGQTITKLNEHLDSGNFHIIIKPIFLKNKYWGAILLGMDKEKNDRSYRYAHKQLTFVILFGLFLAVLIYYFLARNINKSVSKIITGISNFSFDHPNKPIIIGKNDEFGIIADNYNLLIKRIDLYNRKIHQLQNDLVGSTRLAASGQVAASLAHEIRNPLSSIKMMAQIIKSRYLKDNSGINEMNIILEEIERINNKVSELLEFAKPGKLDFIYCNVHKIIEGVLNLCTYTIKERSITLIKEFDNTVPLIYADSEKLRICFLNIILNALQVMKNNSLLKVSSNLTNNKMVINICNSGSTIELDNADKLFEPFLTTREGGTGLGLAISKIIIERHRGSISINKKENFICFTIIIPIENLSGENQNGFNSNS